MLNTLENLIRKGINSYYFGLLYFNACIFFEKHPCKKGDLI